MAENTNLKKMIALVEATPEYKAYKAAHPELYLVHLFQMTGINPQVGYYSTKTKKVTTFDLGIPIQMREEVPFQEEAHTIKGLDIKKIKLSMDEALAIADTIRKEKYKSEPTNKQILILQNIEQGQMFNITFVTNSFKTLNVKINAETTEVISHSLANLIGF